MKHWNIKSALLMGATLTLLAGCPIDDSQDPLQVTSTNPLAIWTFNSQRFQEFYMRKSGYYEGPDYLRDELNAEGMELLQGIEITTETDCLAPEEELEYVDE